MKSRRFTLSQARAALALVRPIARDIHARALALEALRSTSDAVLRAGDIGRLEAELLDLLEELSQLGCACKGYDARGVLVDFPGQREGRDVCWCWQSSEPQIAYFHYAEEGFASRKPLGEETE